MDLRSTSRDKHRDVFVLSGGANRGAVQVGMMDVLLEHGIVPDALVGTSVGALNAAFMGLRPDRDRVRELAHRWLRAVHARHLPRWHAHPDGPPAAAAPLPVLPRRAGPLDRRLAAGGEPGGPAHAGPGGDHPARRRHGRLPPARSTRPAPARLRGRPGGVPARGATGDLRTPRSARRRRRLRPRARSAGPPTWPPRGCSSWMRACRHACPGGVRRSTSWSPVSAWRPGCAPNPTSARASASTVSARPTSGSG